MRRPAGGGPPPLSLIHIYRKIAFLSQRRAGNESDKSRLFLYDCRTHAMQDLTEDFDYNAMRCV